MLHFSMLRPRQSSPSSSAPSSIGALPRQTSSFHQLSTFHSVSLSPFPATLTNSVQRIENTTTLSPAFATLTRNVTRKPCICHSYEKHPGVRVPLQLSSRPRRPCPLAPHPIFPIEHKLDTLDTPMSPQTQSPHALAHTFRHTRGWGPVLTSFLRKSGLLSPPAAIE